MGEAALVQWEAVQHEHRQPLADLDEVDRVTAHQPPDQRGSLSVLAHALDEPADAADSLFQPLV